MRIGTIISKTSIPTWQYIIAIISPCLFIFPYGKYRCNHKEFKYPLEIPLFFGLDGWSATHFSSSCC